MAARLRPFHQEEVKAKIQTSQLINLLQNHALEGNEIDSTRIDAAKFLLNKRLSNAPTEIDQKTEVKGELNHAVALVPQLTKEEWLEAHGLGTSTRATE